MDPVRMSFSVGSINHWMSFLGVCQEQGIELRRHFSGKFDLRITPERHEINGDDCAGVRRDRFSEACSVC